MEITGKIEKEILNEAINLVVKENDALRIIFHENDNSVYQEILENPEITIEYHDFSINDNPLTYAINYLQKSFKEVFVLKEMQLFDFKFIKVADTTFLIYAKVHHIIIDGWSVAFLYAYIIKHYNLLVSGMSDSDINSYSFKNFINEYQRYTKSLNYNIDKDFWKNEFNAPITPLFMKTDMLQNGTRQTITIKREFYNKIIKYAEQYKCTAFHFFLSCVFACIHRLTDRYEITLGVPTLNRKKTRQRRTLGFFNSLLPFKMNLKNDMDFNQLMEAIKNKLWQVYRHQQYPFWEIINQLPEFNKSINLFEIVFSYMKQDYEAKFIGCEDIKIVKLTHGHDLTPLTIFVKEFRDDMDVQIDFEYQPSFFTSDLSIIDIIKAFEDLITNI